MIKLERIDSFVDGFYCLRFNDQSGAAFRLENAFLFLYICVYIYIYTHVFIGDDRVDRVYDLVSRIRITNIGNPCVNRYRARV